MENLFKSLCLYHYVHIYICLYRKSTVFLYLSLLSILNSFSIACRKLYLDHPIRESQLADDRLL